MKSFNGLVSEYKLFTDSSVNGYLHPPGPGTLTGGVVLTHGAGGNCQSPLLVSVASQLAAAGFHVLRCDLAFRKKRPSGPPHPSGAGEDRQSLREAAAALERIVGSKPILGGHSYGGRQASMLASEDPSVADSLLLLSYPLHPPLKPAALRTEHFSALTVRCLFIHGTKDGFGTIPEMQAALKLLSGPAALSVIEGAGHDLNRGRFDARELILPQLLNYSGWQTIQNVPRS